MTRSPGSKPRGLLKSSETRDKMSHTRTLSSPDLQFFIEHFWIIKWDLRDQEPVKGEVLPHPSIHLVFERDNTLLTGIHKGKYTRILEGKGAVFGIKFRPGAFYPFVKTPVSKFANKTFIPWEYFGLDNKSGEALETAILSQEDDEKAIDIAEKFLRERLPEQDPTVEEINQIVKRIISDQTITKVEDVAALFNQSKRALQRLFNQYVGVSPKWVIKRYRLLEALEQLNQGRIVDLTNLALDLGYFDQAHFIKDFKSLVGKSPTEYAKRIS